MRDRRARRDASSVGVAAIAVAVAVAGAMLAIAIAVVAAVVSAAPAAADGEVTIEVSANGEPADSAPGPTVESGAAVTLRYTVTVGSSEPLYDFVVANLTGDVKPDCDTDGDGQPDGGDGHPGPLSGGGSFSCVATVVAGDPGITYASVGRVTAYDVDVSQTFVHEDVAHYTTSRPTTTQAPTTQAPTTRAPTTVVATTVSTSASTTATTASTTATTASTTTSTTSASTTSTSTTADPTTTSTATDVDAAAPDELAATDDSDGFPVGWVVLAFTVGGGLAAGVSSLLSDRRAAVPDR